ncbi:hypothetical protein D5086_004197 [Populus alba]|uniref:Uncharacterized protein n=1 Tax=Populus alba TaxID=43335 RepID=A0ACC4CR47_POPAL
MQSNKEFETKLKALVSGGDYTLAMAISNFDRFACRVSSCAPEGKVNATQAESSIPGKNIGTCMNIVQLWGDLLQLAEPLWGGSYEAFKHIDQKSTVRVELKPVHDLPREEKISLAGPFCTGTALPGRFWDY